MRNRPTYEQRKASARERIMCLQVYLATHDVSWGELAEIQDKIEKIAHNNGLTQELRDEGIL